jgi:LDH2 family malate/lactate/ureidoglycolate dehydrogenase
LTAAATPSVHVPAAWLTDVVAGLFATAGLSQASARTIAGSLVEADMRGIPSHGVMLVPMYLDRLEAGTISAHDEAVVVVDAGAVAVLDGGHALGQLTGDQAMALAIEKARHHGVGAVVVRRAFHFGGAFRYVMQAADAGCIGVAAANTRPLMPAPGGAEAVVGNNPLAVGVPTAGDPIVLDIALSEVALGKIRLAEQEGRKIPSTWATDANGEPTTDPAAAIAGLLLPSGMHKGYGLALIVDVLTGVLSGGAFGSDVKGLYADVSVPNDCAHFFLALDVGAFASIEEFQERVGALGDAVTGSTRAPGVDRLYLPGQIEAERHAEAAANGIELDASVLEALRNASGGDLPRPPTMERATRG